MFVFCIAVLLFSSLYEPWLLRRMLRWPKLIWPFQILSLLFSLGFFAVIATRVFVEPNLFWAGLYDFLGLFFIFQVYLFFYMRLVQIVGLIVGLVRRLNTKVKKPLASDKPSSLVRIAAIIGPVLCAGLVIYGAVRARSFTVTEYEIVLPGLETPVTAIHLPDLHLGDSRGKAYLVSVLEVVENVAPDMVIYNGDLVDSKLALRDEVFDLFKTVKAEQYFTTGNHEYYVGADLVVDWAKKVGLKVLRSEMVVTHGIQLIGLEYMNADRESTDAHQVNQLAMDEELPKIPRSPDLPMVVIHHSPVGLKYVQEAGAAAMLSGHTHGGQLFPGTIIIKSRFPFIKGRYQLGKTTLIVSQGAGTFGPMMRLGTDNEVQIIKFVPGMQGS